VANKPGHRGARRKPLKPLRAGMPGDSVYSLLLVCVLPLPSAHEAAGATGIRHSHALFGGRFSNASDASRREGVNVRSGIRKLSFPDVQVHIVDAPLGAGPESILPVVVMDSGLARSLSSGRASRGPVGAPRNDGSQLNWLFEN